MTAPVTFGVEIKFLMAYVLEDAPLPNHAETRQPRLYQPETDIEEYPEQTKTAPETREAHENGARFVRAKQRIREVLQEANLPVGTIDTASDAPGDYTKWEVVDDSSIEVPHDRIGYSYFQMEVRSPTYVYAVQALDDVRLVCRLLQDNFVLRIVPSCALHVHTGQGDQGFSFETIRRLVSFLWAFEPQLNSLHPPERQDTCFARSLRESSRYSLEYQDRYDRIPTGLDGAVDIQSCQDFNMLCQMVEPSNTSSRYAQVSLAGVLAASKDTAHKMKTVEWRQHQGTLDADAICHWITTVVEIMEMMRDVDYSWFAGDLLMVALQERWMKLGDGLDGQREVEMGPILAESGFTVVDLLRTLDLKPQAEYYSGRWHKLEKRAAPPRKSRIVWAYETEEEPGTSRYATSHAGRLLWEQMRVLVDMQFSPVMFDPDDEMWPKHSLRAETPTMEEWGNDEGIDDTPSES
ncbi:hypothetical protein MBM_05823 [Drepanopeziza brunnea f. sp. 'multigermtubi' MB_m1]|uniref:Amidoligase enzyme n=1 Tax=Marssonina brunnea f. sp. multigermtubi (strain MB_m1) TaxID=1072389 RepID=K1WTN5_MARBU|nr:uncharacterized protein MBM_05823 [Drepanopeziza brunnea f. sp. 'multigermtubi' MB_m1]EKD15812.1 hypothetical protein MBM_05823 [Drepanopeziza brunnea f. sp. 'multigermtubi' MB_m1]